MNFPGYNSILALGTFRIFPENLIIAEDVGPSTTYTDHQIALEKAVLNSLTEVSSRPPMKSSPSPQPPPYESLGSLLPESPLLPSPTLIRRMSTKRKKQRPPTLKTRHLNDAPSIQTTPDQSSRLPTPPSSVISVEDTNFNCNTSTNEPSNSSTKEPATSILPPNIDKLIDDIYCDSPTLGSEECFQQPVKIEPFSPPAPHTPKINTPQSSPEPVPVEMKPLANLEKRCSSVYSGQFYDPPAMAHEYGVRPGEREIMAEEFGTMFVYSKNLYINNKLII